MKRMLCGIGTALLVTLLHSAPAAASNIIWATLADEACSQSQIDLYVRVHDPFYYSEWMNLIVRDQEAWEYFSSVGGDLYLTFLKAQSVTGSC